MSGSTPAFTGTMMPGDSGAEMCPLSTSSSAHLSDISSRKRKSTSYHAESEYDDDTGDDSKSTRTTDDSKKQNHSVIEKRRRDKMNLYITELASMVPMCHAMSRKLDKLTVLRMAVQHLKTIRGAVNSYPEGHYKPAFLSDQELKMLILQAVDGFLFVVGCDRGRILYVSESVSQILNYTQADLLGQSWFDILHPKDVAKVKEQLSSSDISPRERFIDAKTMLPVKADMPQGVSRLCPGARRSFFCRMKAQQPAVVKEESDASSNFHGKRNQHCFDRKYCVIQCTGYLKSWLPAEIGLEEQESDDSCNLFCLVAFGRIQPTIIKAPSPELSLLNVRPLQFTSRHAMDGKFLFVDHRSTLVLNFLPQELLGTSMYEHFHPEDIPILAEAHKSTLISTKLVKTATYRFKTRDGSYVRMQTDWKAFKNPWTKDVEYLIANNSLISTEVPYINSNTNNNNNGECGLGKTEMLKSVAYNCDFYEQSEERDMQQLITSHVESSKIGSQIVEEVLESQRRGESSTAGSADVDRSTIPFANVPNFSSQMQIPTINTVNASPPLSQPPSSNSLGNQTNESFPPFNQVRNNVSLASATDQSGSTDDEMMEIIGTNVLPDSSSQISNSDGNDEAAMAVIMSLLEADAGLGGPVDFSGLPWPLP